MPEADVVRRIADAVLYEGYILWPYRRSAMKNHQRWTFGGVYPEAHSSTRGGDDPSLMRAEVLLEADDDAEIDVRLRFLHVVERRVGRATGDGLEFVDQLTVAGERHLAWDEAVEREVAATGLRLAALGAGHRVAIDFAGGEEEESLGEEDGRRAGAVVLGPLGRQVDGDLRVVVGDHRLGRDIDDGGHGDALGVVREAGEVGLLEPLVAEHRVSPARIEVEGPAALVVGRATDAHRQDVFESEQPAHDDRPVGPWAGPGDNQSVAPRLHRPLRIGVGGDPILDVLRIPLELPGLDVLSAWH